MLQSLRKDKLISNILVGDGDEAVKPLTIIM